MSVIKLIIKNNHDQYRTFQQIDKIIFDLITKFFFVDVQKLIVKFFNEINHQIQKNHDSICDQQFLHVGMMWIELNFGSENPTRPDVG